MNAKNRMAKDTFVFLPAKLLEGIITMLTTAFYTNLFLSETYGIFQDVNTYVNLLYLVVGAWLLNAAARYVGDAIKDGGQAKKQFFTTASVCFLGVSAISALAAGILYVFTKNMLYLGGFIMLITYALFQILNAMLVQVGKIKESVILSLSSAVFKLVGAYIFTWIIPNGTASPYSAILANAVANLVAGFFAVFALEIPSSFSAKSFSSKAFKQFATFGFPLVGLSLGLGLLTMVDRIIVNNICGNEQFAVYIANYSISSGLFTLVMTAVMRGVYPNVLREWRNGSVESTTDLLNKGTRLYMLIALPCVTGLFGVGPAFSEIFFAKPEYHHGTIIGIAALIMFFTGLTEYANKAWELTSNTVPILINSVVSAAVKVAVSIVLVKKFGIYGAAYGSLIAFIFYFVLSKIVASRKFVYKLPISTTLKITVSAVLCGVMARLTFLLPIPKITALILAMIVGATVYAVTLIFSGEVKEEVNLILGFLQNLKNKKIKSSEEK